MLQLNSKLSRPFHLGIILLSLAALITACASQNAAKGNAGGEPKRITDIITSEDDESATVTIKGNQTLAYTAIKQVFPLGVLFHFPETTLDNIKTVHYPPENEFISSIRATQMREDDGQTSRIFINLKKDIPYNVEPDRAGISIVFPKTVMPTADAPAEALQQEAAESEPVSETEKSELKPIAEPKAPAIKATPILPKKPSQPASRLTSIAAAPHRGRVVIDVRANGTITNYKSFTISQAPPRIVYDIYKLKSPFRGEQRIAVKSDLVNKIRHFGHPDKLRIVLETEKAYLAKFSDKPTDNGLVIYVGDAPLVVGDEKTRAIIAPSAQSMPMSPQQPPAAEKSQTSGGDKQAWLNRIDFTSVEAGKSTIIVGTTMPVKYEIRKVTDKRLLLKLLQTDLPEYRKRALITTRFQSAVDRITPFYATKSKNTIIDIELREPVPYFVKQSEDVIRVHFEASTIPPRPYEDAKLPAWKNAMAEPPDQTGSPDSAGQPAKPVPDTASGTPKQMEPKAEVLPLAGETAKSPLAEKEPALAERLNSRGEKNKYTGEKISLDFYDTDIKNVFRIIREISGKNFAIDKNVTGKVTLALDKPVPWDQVLDLVLKMNQLGMKMEGDIIRISTLNSLAQEEKLRQAQLKATQQAAEQQKALEPLITAYIPVSYSDAEDEILPHVQPVMTEGRGKASVDTRNNQLILTDTAEKISQIREIVRKIDQVTPQVIIEARIVEANTTFTKDLGFDWGTVTAGPFEVGDADLTLRGLASNLPQSIPSGVAGFDFVKLSGTPFTIIDAKLVVSETEGKTNIISAPKVVTLDNKKAKIKQGLEVPYLERDSSGNATVRFKNVDLLLEVTPNVTPDERIVMKIFVTKNDVAEQTQDGPALATNEAETELLVENGDTIVIGGIVKSAITYKEKGLPGLRNVGVLGWLFKSQEKTDTKNELLIFITPRIVQLEQKKGTSI